MKLPRFTLLFCLVACQHTETTVTGNTFPQPPFDTPPSRLTFGAGNEYDPSWTPDGQHILYSYSPPATLSVLSRDERCLAIIPANGGTQLFTHCETRGTYADSATMFLGAAIRPNGQIIFSQGSSAFGAIAPTRFTLVLADTAAPSERRTELAVFPRQIGDSAIGVLTQVRWLDADHFLAVGNRFLVTQRPPPSTIEDTVLRPIYLVRGTMSGNTLALAQVTGTENVAHWTIAPYGDILFVRGFQTGTNPSAVVEDANIWRVPVTGGTRELQVTVFPSGGIRTLQCGSIKCILVIANFGFIFDPSSLSLTLLPLTANAVAAWITPEFSPDGTRVVYRIGSQLLVQQVPYP